MPQRDHSETFIQYRERIMDPISSTYCAAKWYNATIWLGHGQTASCHHPPGHWIPLEELKDNYTAIHNTMHKKKMRKLMLEGERPAECEYCWKIEDLQRDNISDRTFKTAVHSDALIAKSAEMPWDDNVELSTLEISFDRACNLKCSYCNPAFSTAWVKDIQTYGPYQNIQSDGRGHFTDTAPWAEPATKHEEDNPYIQAFHKWWDASLADTLEEIRITGGEPAMHPGTWRLFDWFEANPHRGRQMRVAVNSNLSPETPKVLDKLIEKSWSVPNFELYTSNECTKDQAEYIRDGLDYDYWKANIIRVLKESNVRKLHIMMTINALCLHSIVDFMEEMLELRSEFGQRAPRVSVNILRFPSFQSAAIIPVEIKAHYKAKLEEWLALDRTKEILYDDEYVSFQRLVDYLDIVKTPHKNTSDTPKLYNDFKAFYSQYDIRRGKNFVDTFPGLFADWFNSIEAEIPSADDILSGNVVFGNIERAGDPATDQAYTGGDDEHEKKQGGWDTDTDTLGGG